MIGFGRAVAGAGPVEVGEYVGGTLVQGAAERGELDQGFRYATAERGDQRGHQLSAAGAVGFAVGGDHPLVDAPGRFDLDVVLAREQLFEAGLLLVGEQVSAGVQGPPGSVERVGGATAVSVQVQLDAASAAVQPRRRPGGPRGRGPSPRPRPGVPRWWRS